MDHGTLILIGHADICAKLGETELSRCRGSMVALVPRFLVARKLAPRNSWFSSARYGAVKWSKYHINGVVHEINGIG